MLDNFPEPMKHLGRVLDSFLVFATSSRYPQCQLLLATLCCVATCSATLHSDRTCSMSCQPLQSGNIGSTVSSHIKRFAPVGRRSYDDPIMKLHSGGTMFSILFHVSNLCKASSQAVNWPCCACCTALWTCFPSLILLISLITMSLLCLLEPFDHH